MRGTTVAQDRYVVEDVLGRGGMAEVWRARDTRLDRPVAIKFLARPLGDDAEHLVRFFAEAQSIARIQHPNVATVLDFGEESGYPFLVMLYLPGGSLADLLGKPLPLDRALQIGADVAAAAGAAHAQGIVHRDIKPGNVLLDESGKPRLADFGIASLGTGERLTDTGMTMGSPNYIAPEQALDAGTSPASDVYAIGVVLYEMLTGRKPFEGDSATAVAFAHVDQTPSPPSSHVPGLDPSVDALILRCLNKDPEERFSDGTELADAIRSIAAGDKVLVAGDTAPLDPAPASAEPRRRRRRAVLVCAVALLAIAGFAVTRGPNSPNEAVSRADTRERRPAVKAKRSPSPEASQGAQVGSPTPSPRQSDASSKETGGAVEDDGESEVEEPAEPSPTPSPSASPEPSPEPSPEATPSP